jgi:hypothetical protein
MKPRFERIVLTNIPGADWDSNFEKSFVQSLTERLKEKDLSLDVFSVRDQIYKFAEEEDVAIAPRVIHRASDEKVRLLRRLAFLQLENELAGQENAPVKLVVTRATSYADSTQEESLSMHYLEAIDPDLLIVVIDDPVAIYKRLPNNLETKKYARELKIKDIALWMRYEVEKMREFAHDLRCPLYVIPRLQVGALVDLITTEKKTAYLSYPMSLAKGAMAEGKKKLLEKLREQFIVFDPECMGSAHDESLMTDDEQGYNRDSVKKRDEKWFISINSEYVIVYLADRVPAHGSQTELDRASEQGKVVWVVLEPSYTTAEGMVSPFIDRPSDLTFVSSDELEHFLDLNEEQKAVYAYVLETMWGFKRRKGLVSLVGEEPNEEAEKEIYELFYQECSEKYQHDTSRALLPVLGNEDVHQLVEACWSFNKPLWLNPVSQPALFPAEELQRDPNVVDLPLAAKLTIERPSSFVIAPLSRRIPEDNNLSDEEAFAAIFPKHASSSQSAEYCQSLKDFFRTEDLGALANWLGFLRWLRTVLETGGHRARSVFKMDNLRALFKEYQSKEFKP